MHGAADRRQLEDVARQLVESSMYLRQHPDADELNLVKSKSLRRRLVTDVTQAAMEHAFAKGLDGDALFDLARNGISIVSGLEYALTRDRKIDLSENARSDVNWNFWRHDDQAQARMRAQDFPHMSRDSIEQDAYNYLDLPYRAPLLERTIVDILIALELFAFGKEMLEKLPLGFRWLNRSPIAQKHVLRRYVGSQIVGAVFLLGPAWLVGAFGPALVGETATLWIVGPLVGLFVLGFIISTVAVPFAWRQQRKSKRKARDLLGAMTNTYGELTGGSQISTRRLREVAVRAADLGVVWPAPLFLILDDNIARTGRV